MPTNLRDLTFLRRMAAMVAVGCFLLILGMILAPKE